MFKRFGTPANLRIVAVCNKCSKLTEVTPVKKKDSLTYICDKCRRKKNG